MLLENFEAEYTDEFEGKAYGFCSQWCKDLFHANPKRFIEMPGSHKGTPTLRGVPEER
jgi:YHS domain-containing protein